MNNLNAHERQQLGKRTFAYILMTLFVSVESGLFSLSFFVFIACFMIEALTQVILNLRDRVKVIEASLRAANLAQEAIDKMKGDRA